MNHSDFFLCLWQMIRQGRFSPLDLSRAADPDLASGATTESCNVIGRHLEAIARGDGRDRDRVWEFAGLVATHASVLGNLRRHAEALILGNYLLNFFRTYGGQEPVTPDAVGHCQLIRAVALQGLGNWAEAADAYGAVLHYYQGKNQRETARALMNRGLMLYNLGRWREALADYDAVLPLYTALRLPEQVACCQMNRGNTLRNLNDYPAAIPAYDAAIAYFRTSPPNRSLEAACLANRGSALMDLGRYHEALAGLAAARAIYADLGEEDEQARCWANLGITVMELGRPTQALEAYDAALDTFLKRQMRRDAALCAANRAAALHELGRDEEALQGYTQYRSS